VWTVDVAERIIQSGRLPLAREYCQGTCNLLYIDDLVAAILLALRKHEAVGEAFNVNGGERPTWYQYFVALNGAMGLPEPIEQSTAASWLSAWVMKPIRSSSKFLLNHFQNQIVAVYKSSALARKAMRRAERVVRRSPTPVELRLYSKQAWYPTAKAARLLGYKPQFSMAEGVQLSVAWLRHHGFVTDCR
jgi:nucleoside-diphosphate-sugar epimerase